MNTKLVRATSIGLIAAFLISFLAIFVPPAVAQSGQARVEISPKGSPVDIGDDNRLDPEAELAKVTWDVKVTFPGVPGGCTSSYTVKYETAAKPTYSTVVLSPGAHAGTVGATQGAVYTSQTTESTKVFNPSMTISITREAPAFKDEEYKLKATVEFPTNTNGCSLTGDNAVGSASIKNDYLALTNVVPSQYFQKAGQNKKVIFPIDVFNIGNGPSRVKVDIIPLGKNRLDSVIPPAELRLESRAQKGASALFKAPTRIEAQTPHSNGYTNSIYSFQAKFSTSYDGAGENTATDETSVTLSVQVQGVYVPGFDSVGMLAALGIALAGMGVLRRKQN